METARHFGGDNVGGLRLAQPRRTNKKCVVKLFAVSLASVQSDFHLIQNTFLTNQVAN